MHCPGNTLRRPHVITRDLESKQLLPELFLAAGQKAFGPQDFTKQLLLSSCSQVLGSKVHTADVTKLLHDVAQFLDAHAKRYRSEVHDALPDQDSLG